MQDHTLVVVATRGQANDLVQLATLVRAATALEMHVRVLFCGDALHSIAPHRIEAAEWAPVYTPVLATVRERLRDADFVDMATFLRDAKEHGDHVTFLAEVDTVATPPASTLSPLLDGSSSRADFLGTVQKGDTLLWL